MGEGPYRLEVARTAQKDMRHMAPNDRKRVLAVVYSLADDPRPRGCEKMTDREEYRVRVGDFRVTYAVADRERVVTIYRATHRKDVYR